jgi:hypothetical protein
MDRAGWEDVLKRPDRKEVRVAVCSVQGSVDARDYKGAGWRKMVATPTVSMAETAATRPIHTAPRSFIATSLPLELFQRAAISISSRGR